MHAGEDRLRARHAADAQEHRERVAIDLAAERRVRAQRLELGTEQERVAEPAVVEGLLAEAVAHEVEATFLAVPQREGEHAVEAGQRVGQAPLVDRFDQHLGVAVAGELATEPAQLVGDGVRVVDLAVVRDHVATRRRAHRLGAVLGEVDDREAAMPERDAGRGVDPGGAGVRSAVREGQRHRDDHVGQLLDRRTVECQHPRNAAHERLPLALPIGGPRRRGSAGKILHSGTDRSSSCHDVPRLDESVRL